MPLNCKPHDIAHSVSTRLPENNGILVRVLRRHINTPEWNFGDLPAWWCKSDQLLTWKFERTGRVLKGYEGPIPDRNLRPIRPGDEANSAHVSESLTA